MEKITMEEDYPAGNGLFSTRTNYGACSLIVLIGAGLSGWFGIRIAFAQAALMLSSAFLQRPSGSFGGNTYGVLGLTLIVVAFLALIWAVALAGAGFAVNRGRVFSLLTILVVLSPVLYILLQFFVALQDAGPALVFK